MLVPFNLSFFTMYNTFCFRLDMLFIAILYQNVPTMMIPISNRYVDRCGPSQPLGGIYRAGAVKNEKLALFRVVRPLSS